MDFVSGFITRNLKWWWGIGVLTHRGFLFRISFFVFSFSYRVFWICKLEVTFFFHFRIPFFYFVLITHVHIITRQFLPCLPLRTGNSIYYFKSRYNCSIVFSIHKQQHPSLTHICVITHTKCDHFIKTTTIQFVQVRKCTDMLRRHHIESEVYFRSRFPKES